MVAEVGVSSTLTFEGMVYMYGSFFNSTKGASPCTIRKISILLLDTVLEKAT